MADKKEPKAPSVMGFTVPPLPDLETRLVMLPLRFSLARQAIREEISRIKNWR